MPAPTPERNPDFADIKLYAEIAAEARTARADGRESARIFGDDDAAYNNTSHRYGYIAPGSGSREVADALEIQPEASLKGTAIRVSLDVLRAADYPGSGEHEVLVDFSAVHNVGDGDDQPVHFGQKFRVQEGQEGGISGYPIFRGLRVGSTGVAFKAFTVNVGNRDDRALLGFLDSDTVTQGLRLLTTANPALGPLSELALGIARGVAKRNDNHPVQDIWLGLDLLETTHARLRIGTYVAVQLRPSWNGRFQWTDWVWDGQAVVARMDGSRLPANYLAFAIMPD